MLLRIPKLTSFHVLVKHDPTHVLNIVEFLVLKELAHIHDVLLLDPDEENPILHHTLRDHQL